MDKIYMFDNNIYAFLLLSILLFVVIAKKDIYDYSRKLFYRMIVFNMVLLIIEILAWVFDGIDTQFAFLMNYGFNFLFIIFEPVMASMWLTYVDYKIYRSRERLKRRWFYLHVPLFAIVLLIVNFFTPVAYSIDSNNVYHRGDWLWLTLLAVFGLVLYTLVLAFKNRKMIKDNMIIFIGFFALLPVLSSFAQFFFYGLLYTWTTVALGVVFAYYLLEIQGNAIDYLTGLYSRKKIEEILRGKIEHHKTFAVVMIDLEYFKDINDKYGHAVGDEVLIHFGKILTKTFGKDNFVSRVGGDEFLIVIRNVLFEDVSKYRKLLNQHKKNYKENKFLSEIAFSYGYKMYENYHDITVDNILDEVDVLMYEDKSKNKNLKRRRTD